jgi:AAA domain
MNTLTTKINLSDWLGVKLANSQNGIAFDDHFDHKFTIVQDFVESQDDDFKTPVVYYQVFPEETASQFLATLKDELASKLGMSKTNSGQSISEVIKDARLKLIILDDIHLQPLDTLQDLLRFFASCNVSVVLLGSRSKMEIAQILAIPSVSTWDQFEILS